MKLLMLLSLLACLAAGCGTFSGEPSGNKVGLGGPVSDRKANPGVSSGADGGASHRITAIR